MSDRDHLRAVGEHERQPDDELSVKAEGPPARPVVWLPRQVKAWMIYCQSGEMRAHAMKEAAFADAVNGWTIQWRPREREYICRKIGRADIVTTIKHEAYMIARGDGHRRPRYEVRGEHHA